MLFKVQNSDLIINLGIFKQLGFPLGKISLRILVKCLPSVSFYKEHKSKFKTISQFIN